MKIKVLISAMLVGVFAQTASARYCDRYDLLLDLRQVENRVSDAEDNLRVIEYVSQVNNLNLCLAGQAFIQMLNTAGNDQTVEVQDMFRSVAEMARNSRDIITLLGSSASNLISLENKTSDAADTARVLKYLVQAYNIEALDALDSASDLMRSVGSSETVEAQQILRSLAEIVQSDRQVYSMNSLVGYVQQINSLENKVSDVTGNINVIKFSVLADQISAHRGFSIFIQELRYFGASDTVKAQDSYRRIVKNVPAPQPIPVPVPRPTPLPPRPRPVPRPIPRPRIPRVPVPRTRRPRR